MYHYYSQAGIHVVCGGSLNCNNAILSIELVLWGRWHAKCACLLTILGDYRYVWQVIIDCRYDT